MIEKQIQILKGFRSSLLTTIDGLSTSQMNFIPPGFNNNIIWNLGHMMAAQHNMTYRKAGLPFPLPEQLILPFLSGTKPIDLVSSADIAILKKSFLTSLDRLQADLKSFTMFSPSPLISKAYGFEINTVEEALSYLLYHDGIHAGRIIAFVKGGLVNGK